MDGRGIRMLTMKLSKGKFKNKKASPNKYIQNKHFTLSRQKQIKGCLRIIQGSWDYPEHSNKEAITFLNHE